MRILPSVEDAEIAYLTTNASFEDSVGNARFYVVSDANITSKLRLVRTFLEVAVVVLRERPDFVLTTGAAPGLFAIVVGRLVGAKTVWLDSMANLEKLSLCGRVAGRFAHLWLTQWPHLASSSGPAYKGSVL